MHDSSGRHSKCSLSIRSIRLLTCQSDSCWHLSGWRKPLIGHVGASPASPLPAYLLAALPVTAISSICSLIPVQGRQMRALCRLLTFSHLINPSAPACQLKPNPLNHRTSTREIKPRLIRPTKILHCKPALSCASHRMNNDYDDGDFEDFNDDGDIEEINRGQDFPGMRGQDGTVALARAGHNFGPGFQQAEPLARVVGDLQRVGFGFNRAAPFIFAHEATIQNPPRETNIVVVGGRVEFAEQARSCYRCGREFRTEEALQEHNRALPVFCPQHQDCFASWRDHVFSMEHRTCPVPSCAKGHVNFGSDRRFIRHFRDKHR